MLKHKLISHLAELEHIRRDPMMSTDIVQKVVELERLLTHHLAEELAKPAVEQTQEDQERVS